MDMKKILIWATCHPCTNCGYKPIIDTAGRSGTFDQDRANLITDDTLHCKTLAKDNTNFVSNVYIGQLVQL